jgi:hypothetical protein
MGIPQVPATANCLSSDAANAGPASGPTGFRVSMTLHGVSV